MLAKILMRNSTMPFRYGLGLRMYSTSRQVGNSILISDTLQMRIPIVSYCNKGLEVKQSLIHTLDLQDTIEQLQDKVVNSSNGRVQQIQIF